MSGKKRGESQRDPRKSGERPQRPQRSGPQAKPPRGTRPVADGSTTGGSGKPRPVGDRPMTDASPGGRDARPARAQLRPADDRRPTQPIRGDSAPSEPRGRADSAQSPLGGDLSAGLFGPGARPKRADRPPHAQRDGHVRREAVGQRPRGDDGRRAPGTLRPDGDQAVEKAPAPGRVARIATARRGARIATAGAERGSRPPGAERGSRRATPPRSTRRRVCERTASRWRGRRSDRWLAAPRGGRR